VRTRSLITSCVLALVLTAVSFQVARTVLMRSFADMEADAMRQGVERARRALEADLAQLESGAVRGGEWDETYAAMSPRPDPRLLAAKFNAEVLQSVGVDLVWIRDAQGRTVLAEGLAPGAPPRLVELSADEIARLERFASRIDSAPAHSPLARLMRMPRGALAFAVAPILHTDHTGPRAGTLVVGRYLGRPAATQAAKASQLPIAITAVGGADALRLPEQVRRWLASSPQAAAPFLRLADAEMLNGYSLLRDLSGEPLAVLSTGVHRDALRLGRRTGTAVIVVVVGGFGCIVLALLLLLNRFSRARALTERRYRSVGRQLEECILLADAQSGAIVEANPAAARALGFEVDEIVGLPLESICRGLAPARLARLREHLAGRRRVLTMTGREGRGFPAEVTLSWIRLDAQELVCLVARDITARRRLERQRRAHRRRLIRLAHRDSLTGLPNRLYLQARLPHLVSETQRDGSTLALLYVDLDHFKDVNDSLGHSSGDRLLVTIAKRLRSCISAGDLVVRMSGDEFIVVAIGLPAASAVDYIARRIEECLSAPIDIDGVRLTIHSSIGISLCPADGSNLETLLKHADIALYQAKSRGRGNHQFFTDAMQAQLSDRLELEHALRRAIGGGQLFIEYQPSFDLNTGAPAGFEALLRWNHPQLGLVPPGRFIPIAEQGNLILDLGLWVLRQVCRQLAEWHREGLPLLPVSINVTPRQFEHGRLVDTIAGLTREFDIDANLLHFEITESAAMQNSEQHLGALQALRQLGSRILIDDFGTGYSSLSYLKHLPIDTLKIDRAFVRDMATDSNDAAIVSAIIGIARSLGLHVVAEGVETPQQVDCLRRLGCNTAQGFYFSRPLPTAEARVVLEKLGARRRGGDTGRLAVLRSVPGGS
jgi:diguanylate cyclase (GGDEF)-like protein/PAS domain S-box-containing protein